MNERYTNKIFSLNCWFFYSGMDLSILRAKFSVSTDGFVLFFTKFNMFLFCKILKSWMKYEEETRKITHSMSQNVFNTKCMTKFEPKHLNCRFYFEKYVSSQNKSFFAFLLGSSTETTFPFLNIEVKQCCLDAADFSTLFCVSFVIDRVNASLQATGKHYFIQFQRNYFTNKPLYIGVGVGDIFSDRGRFQKMQMER